MSEPVSAPLPYLGAEPEQQVGDGGMMHLHAFRLDKRIVQLEKRDIRVLGDQLLKESLMV